MDIYDKIFSLAKEKGISQAFICRSIGKDESFLRSSANYFKKSGKQDHGLPNQAILTIASVLGTTEDYLLGKTDNPNSSVQSSRIALASELKSSIEFKVRAEIAKAMLSDKILSAAAISKYTGLSEADIKELAKKIK